MFSVKNRSNIRQVTPYGEFGPFEAKTFYPVSKIYTISKVFFKQKPQFEVLDDSLPKEPVKVRVPKQEEQKPVLIVKETTEEKVEPEEAVTDPVAKEEVTVPVTEPVAVEDVTKPAEPPVATTKSKARRW